MQTYKIRSRSIRRLQMAQVATDKICVEGFSKEVVDIYISGFVSNFPPPLGRGGLAGGGREGGLAAQIPEQVTSGEGGEYRG